MGSVLGCSSGGVNIAGTASGGPMIGFSRIFGGRRPINPINRNKKQIESTHAKARYESLNSEGKQSRAKSSESRYPSAPGKCWADAVVSLMPQRQIPNSKTI